MRSVELNSGILKIKKVKGPSIRESHEKLQKTPSETLGAD